MSTGLRFAALGVALAACFAAPLSAGAPAKGHEQHVAARQLAIEPVNKDTSSKDDNSDMSDSKGDNKKFNDKNDKKNDKNKSKKYGDDDTTPADKAMLKAREELIDAKKDKIGELQDEIKDDQKELKKGGVLRGKQNQNVGKMEDDGDSWDKEEDSDGDDFGNDSVQNDDKADEKKDEDDQPKSKPWQKEGLSDADRKIMIAKDHLKNAQKMKIEELQKALQGLGGQAKKARR
jgi:hypothetical protein